MNHIDTDILTRTTQESDKTHEKVRTHTGIFGGYVRACVRVDVYWPSELHACTAAVDALTARTDASYARTYMYGRSIASTTHAHALISACRPPYVLDRVLFLQADMYKCT